MPRDDVRTHIRLAQAAEISGDRTQAVEHLAQAARLHLSAKEWARSAALLRHALRLAPARDDLSALLAEAESAEKVQATRPLSLAADEIQVLQPHALGDDEATAPAPVRRLALEPARESTRARAALDVAPRGPTQADAALDCWCSFCCRPKSEAGQMIAGPAGAFICGECIATAARLASVAIPPAAARASPSTPAPERDDRLVDDAVALAKLGWGLADVRSLSREERARALALIAPAAKAAKPAPKRKPLLRRKRK